MCLRRQQLPLRLQLRLFWEHYSRHATLLPKRLRGTAHAPALGFCRCVCQAGTGLLLSQSREVEAPARRITVPDGRCATVCGGAGAVPAAAAFHVRLVSCRCVVVVLAPSAPQRAFGACMGEAFPSMGLLLWALLGAHARNGS